MRESRVDQVGAASVLHLNLPGGDGEGVFRLLGTRKHVGRTAKNRGPGRAHRKRGIEAPGEHRRARPDYAVSMIWIGHSSLPQKSVPPVGGGCTTLWWCLQKSVPRSRDATACESNAAYFLILYTTQPQLRSSQSWLQPAFSRPLSREGSLTSRKSRLKGGCGQDCPPHDKCRTSPTEKVCGIRRKRPPHQPSYLVRHELSRLRTYGLEGFRHQFWRVGDWRHLGHGGRH